MHGGRVDCPVYTPEFVESRKGEAEAGCVRQEFVNRYGFVRSESVCNGHSSIPLGNRVGRCGGFSSGEHLLEVDVAETRRRSDSREEVVMACTRRFRGKISDENRPVKRIILAEPFFDVSVTTEANVEPVSVGEPRRHDPIRT
jgi:hypothetical protein